MTRKELEKQFTAMLVRTGSVQTYLNLLDEYIFHNKNCQLIPESESKTKLSSLVEGDPKEWITKIFTEGLDIPPLLYRINTYWLKHLEDINWK